MSLCHIPFDRLTELGADSPSTEEAAHLRTCPACEQTRREMASLLGQVADAIAADADAHFPADRLTRQRARIMTQLQQVGHQARVIAFPGGAVPPAEMPGRTRPASRWIAAAAVAGLLVGVVAGRAEHDYSRRVGLRAAPPAQAQLASRATEPVMAPGRQGPAIQEAILGADDDLLGQIENAADRGLAALEGLDELTPLPWEQR
jgi:hypothetical protein